MGKVVTSDRFGDLSVTQEEAMNTESTVARASVTRQSHTVKLTKDRIKKLEYQGNGRSRCVYWDTVLTGFGVRVYPSGKKSYVISYRFEGRKRLHTLGKVEAFRQVDGGLGRAFGGIGLGIPLATGIIQLHGGQLDITSEPGRGTRVCARLPQG